jgi:hypothetical protein
MITRSSLIAALSGMCAGKQIVGAAAFQKQ